MDEHDHFPWIGLYIIEEPLKLGALGDLLPACASFIVLKKGRLREITQLRRFSDGPLLGIDAVVIFLHLARDAHIANHNNSGVVRMIRLSHASFLSYTFAALHTVCALSIESVRNLILFRPLFSAASLARPLALYIWSSEST